MSFKALDTVIKNKLSAITKIVDVKSDPISDFSGYPAAYVIPSDNESDFETNVENQRRYAFIVRIFYQVGEGDTARADAYNAMKDLIDDVLNNFETDELLSAVILPTNYTMLGIATVPSLWLYLEEERLLMAELKITARISVDVS